MSTQITGAASAPFYEKIVWDSCDIGVGEAEYRRGLLNDGDEDELDRFAAQIERFAHEVEDEDALNELGHFARLKAIWASMSDSQRERVTLDEAFGDSDLYEREFDDLARELSEEMGRLNPDGRGWYVEGEGLGWRSQSGHKYFLAKDGRELLRAVLPDTDCTYTITPGADHLHIVNSHHDAMGEVYVIRPFKLDRGVTFSVQPALYDELRARLESQGEDGHTYEEGEEIFAERRDMGDGYEARARVVFSEEGYFDKGLLFEVDVYREGEHVGGHRYKRFQSELYFRDWLNDKMEADFTVWFERAAQEEVQQS